MRISPSAATRGTSGSGGPGWPEACRREEAIRKLLGRSDGERLKVGDVEEVALELGVSRATLYRLITARKRRGGRGTAPAASLPPVLLEASTSSPRLLLARETISQFRCPKKKLSRSDRATNSPAVPQARIRRRVVLVAQHSRDRT